jgi:hypothetical protein
MVAEGRLWSRLVAVVAVIVAVSFRLADDHRNLPTFDH